MHSLFSHVFLASKFINVAHISLVKPAALKRRRDSSVGIATGYRLDCLGSIIGREIYFSSPQHKDHPWNIRNPPIRSVSLVLSTGANWTGRKPDNSPPSNADVKKGGAIIPFPQSLHCIVLKSLSTWTYLFF
jgi:hypothetical protein